MSTPALSPLLQRFFTDRLLGQLGASPHTIASYRDTFRLLLPFASKQFKRAPSALLVENLDVRFLSRFLDHLERDRGNTPRTRTTRLSALHAFFQYAALNEPALALHCQRVLAMPAKRCEHHPVEFLTDDEVSALISSPDVRTWIVRRERALLLLAVHTSLRHSHITSLPNPIPQ